MNEELIAAARTVSSKAYAPYSKYRVGAAIRDEEGRTHVGCNVENVAYPVGMCAERVAIGRMVADGGQRVLAIAVATRDGGPPCGMCLQALAEFTDNPADLTVITVAESGESASWTLSDLLPHGFSSRLVG